MSELYYDLTERVLTVTINRPAARNTISYSVLDEMLEVFERVLALDPDNPHALVHLARLASSEQKYDELKTLVARYLATQPEGDRITEMRALRAFSLSDSAATARLLAESKNVSTLDLYSMYLAATSYTENMEAGNAVVSMFIDREQRIEPAFAITDGGKEGFHGSRITDVRLDSESPSTSRPDGNGKSLLTAK